MREALAWWMELFATKRLGKLRVRRKSDGVLVGRAGYGVLEDTGEPELGYALYPEFWGNGYALEAAAGLRDWIFRERIGTTSSDLPMSGIHRRSGFWARSA